MAQMQEYLKEYIRLVGNEDLQAVQPVKMNRTAEAEAEATAAPANKIPATYLTTSRFQTQPSTTRINDVVAKPVTKPYKPQPSVLNDFDHLIEKEKDQEPVREEEVSYILDHEEESHRLWKRDKGSEASLNRHTPANFNRRKIII